MSIEQLDKIDFVTIENATGDCVLSITDHLDWSIDESRHLWLLQSKLNHYLQFALDGQMHEDFPDLKGRRVIVQWGSEYPISERGHWWFEKAREKWRNAESCFGMLWWSIPDP